MTARRLLSTNYQRGNKNINALIAWVKAKRNPGLVLVSLFRKAEFFFASAHATFTFYFGKCYTSINYARIRHSLLLSSHNAGRT